MNPKLSKRKSWLREQIEVYSSKVKCYKNDYCSVCKSKRKELGITK